MTKLDLPEDRESTWWTMAKVHRKVELIHIVDNVTNIDDVEDVSDVLVNLGDFNDLVKSQYFISNTAKNQFFKMASAKVPFYFIFYACEKIQN